MKIKRRYTETPEGKAIQEVYNKFGGTNKCAKKFGIGNRLLSYWKRRGKVPLHRVAELSKAFGVSPFVLNKKEVEGLFQVCEEWEE